MMKREECLDDSFAENLCRWSETIRKTYYEGACEDIITTRRLEHIVVAFGIFKDRLDAVKKGVARFNKITKDSFIDLYTKLDAEVAVAEIPVPVVPAHPPIEDDDRVDLDVPFAHKDTARSHGARWDATTKTWHISGYQYKSMKAIWDVFTPKSFTSALSSIQYTLNS
jgi:hypothetical protein